MTETERKTLESVRARIKAEGLQPWPAEPGFFTADLTPEYHPKVRLHAYADKVMVWHTLDPDEADALAMRLVEQAEACRERRRAFMAGEYPPKEG